MSYDEHTDEERRCAAGLADIKRYPLEVDEGDEVAEEAEEEDDLGDELHQDVQHILKVAATHMDTQRCIKLFSHGEI